jgi:hypothetical protein
MNKICKDKQSLLIKEMLCKLKSAADVPTQACNINTKFLKFSVIFIVNLYSKNRLYSLKFFQ